jgi:hypothetical protein
VTTRGVAPQIVNHYNVQPVFDVYANVDRQDLGSVGVGVEKIMDEGVENLPRGTTSICAARSPPCKARSTAWDWAWRSRWCWSTS